MLNNILIKLATYLAFLVVSFIATVLVYAFSLIWFAYKFVDTWKNMFDNMQGNTVTKHE